jgi:brefeldin A-resistance guanine nucleotide exchange factor 1
MAQTFTRSTAVSVAVDPVALITTECITVTSAMRKHARWAHSSVSAILSGGGITSPDSFNSSRPQSTQSGLARKGEKKSDPSPEVEEQNALANRWGLRGKKGKSMQDNPLMSAFAILRRDVAGCKGTMME